MSDTEVSMESRLICELIGTFALTFIGAGSIMMGGDLTTVALAHGVVLAVVVTATMNISGGHINPAVTIAMMIVKKIDNDAGMTTRGTPQDMCATPAEILITGCKLAREHIDMLRQVAPVEIVMMAGNHDRHSSLALMMYLSAAYENVRDVEIVITPNNRRYIEYGNTLLGFTHGDGLGKTALGPLMAVEAREQWGNTEHKVWFHGHLHHQRMHEKDGCLIIQMPSLAGHDRYHARSGYTTSKAGLAAYLIDDKEGYIGSLFAPVSHE